MAKQSKKLRDHPWEAQDDMRTLVKAHQIHKDPKRHAAAKAAARSALKDQAAEQAAMQQVSQGAPPMAQPPGGVVPGMQ